MDDEVSECGSEEQPGSKRSSDLKPVRNIKNPVLQTFERTE